MQVPEAIVTMEEGVKSLDVVLFSTWLSYFCFVLVLFFYIQDLPFDETNSLQTAFQEPLQGSPAHLHSIFIRAIHSWDPPLLSTIVVHSCFLLFSFHWCRLASPKPCSNCCHNYHVLSCLRVLSIVVDVKKPEP